MPPSTLPAATLAVGPLQLHLLSDRALYLPSQRALLVSDLHLGKAETFQHFGLPVPSQVNQGTLARLAALWQQWEPETLWILGDLFHGREALADGVIDAWLRFLDRTQGQAHLILGNHDRPMQETLAQLSVQCWVGAVEVGGVLFSHEPEAGGDRLNICGHIHPCLRLSGGGDRLRLPCFHWQPRQQRLTLPSFGEFTGGYDIALARGETAYVVAEGAVVEFSGRG